MSEPIRLLVVDDHTLFRRGLVALLATEGDLVVAGEAADAGEATRRARELQPDVILLDNHLPGVTGIAALAGLKEAAPAARVLMLTVSEDEAERVKTEIQDLVKKYEALVESLIADKTQEIQAI